MEKREVKEYKIQNTKYKKYNKMQKYKCVKCRKIISTDGAHLVLNILYARRKWLIQYIEV